MTYKNIIVGIDRSEFSKAALVEAARLAKSSGGQLSLVRGEYSDTEEFSTTTSSPEKKLERGKELCEEIRTTFTSECNVEMKCVVREGEPHEVIVEVADEMKADLIAMGTHGRRGLKRMIMGSVTWGVIQDSKCDILVVRKRNKPGCEAYANILLPYDGSDQSKMALERAIRFKKENPEVVVTLLYVIPRYEEMIGFIKTEAIQEKLYEEARKIVLTGLEIAKKNDVLISTIMEEGHSADKIIDVAAGLGTDLIVMGSHGWRGFSKAMLGSTAERIITHSEVPVLIAR